MAFNTAIGRAEYTASAAQTIFTFTFKIFNTSDVKVYLTPVGQTADDTADLLIETTDYTISINGDNGGDVTLTTGATLNDSITLVRSLPIDRDTEYQNNGDLQADTLNSDQEYQTYLTLDASVDFERSLKMPNSVQGFNVILPSPEADKMFIYNQDGTAIDLIDPSSTALFKDAFIVENMLTLLSVNETTYSSVNVRGYYSKNDGGGGLFNWDSTIDKSTANAGTIIDPGQTLANQGAGVGIGCWVRQYDEHISLNWFGAKGDGATDDSSYVQRTIDYVETLTDDISYKNGIGGAFIDITGEGTFALGSTIAIRDINGLRLENISFIAHTSFTASYMFSITSSTNNIENVSIKKCRLDAKHLGGCIYIAGQYKTRISDNYIIGFSTTGIDIEYGCHETMIEDNFIGEYNTKPVDWDLVAKTSICVNMKCNDAYATRNIMFFSGTGIRVAEKANIISQNHIYVGEKNKALDLKNGNELVITDNYIDWGLVHVQGALYDTTYSNNYHLNSGVYSADGSNTRAYMSFYLDADKWFKATLTGNTFKDDTAQTPEIFYRDTGSIGVFTQYLFSASVSDNTFTNKSITTVKSLSAFDTNTIYTIDLTNYFPIGGVLRSFTYGIDGATDLVSTSKSGNIVTFTFSTSSYRGVTVTGSCLNNT